MFKMCCGDCGECWYVGNPRTCKCLDEELKREWVGLTNEEWSDLYEAHHDKYGLPKQGSPDGLDYERAIEAKLRSKNEHRG
jgi:hypothetical protein